MTRKQWLWLLFWPVMRKPTQPAPLPRDVRPATAYPHRGGGYAPGWIPEPPPVDRPLMTPGQEYRANSGTGRHGAGRRNRSQ